jgi:hypothetical protein
MMEHHFETLTILAEITTAFVAFSAIIVSIRLTFGERLSRFQTLLVQFFTESGMLAVSLCLIPLILWGFKEDIEWVALVTTWLTLITTTTYLAIYLRRRFQIDVKTPFISVIVMIGYGLWEIGLIITLMGI